MNGLKTMKGLMAVVFKLGLFRKNEFTDYWSTRQIMNTSWFCIMFPRDHFRKILRALHIVDKTIILACDDPSYIQSVRLRLQLDYINSLTFVTTISLLSKQLHSTKVWLLKKGT